jgi:hypothetical protein
MAELSSIVENYEVHTGLVWKHEIKVVTYQLGIKWICIIESLDVGAAISRISASDRMLAMRLAFSEAKAKIAPDEPLLCEEPVQDIRPEDQGAVEIREIVMEINGSKTSFTMSEFMSLPIQERMQKIMSGALTFVADTGDSIPSGQAIEIMREYAA